MIFNKNFDIMSEFTYSAQEKSVFINICTDYVIVLKSASLTLFQVLLNNWSNTTVYSNICVENKCFLMFKLT